MKSKIIAVVVLALLLVSMSILMFKIQPVEASSEETTYAYIYTRKITYISSFNGSDPTPPETFLFDGKWNITFSSPYANGVINLTVPKESYIMEPVYDPETNITQFWFMVSDGYGKMYTVNDTGDVDVISMTNDTGIFFWKDGAWHPPGEEWIGDNITDPAGSAWLTLTANYSRYLGNGTNGERLGSFVETVWMTTGFSENIIIEPTSRLNGSYINATGFPFTGVGGIVGFANIFAQLKIWGFIFGGPLDLQYKSELVDIKIPSFSAKLFSPANLYVTDPENRHVGTDPNTGELVNQIPKAFYSGPGTHPQRIVIPDPVDGVYDIKIVGTSTGEYTLVVELATLEKTTTDTYTGDISVGKILQSQAIVSEGEMTSTPPTAPVGGISIPVNKLELLVPYVGLTILLAVATMTVVYIKKRKRNTEINS